VAEAKTNFDNVWAAIQALAQKEDAGAIQYPMLLGYLHGQGIQPFGMQPLLDQLQSTGLISKMDSQGKRWMRFGEDEGPLWIHVLVRQSPDATTEREGEQSGS